MAMHPNIWPAQRGISLRHAHPANATAAVVSLYREELARNHAFAAATSAMAQALLTSIGPDNKTFLEAHFNPDPLYSLTPRQIVDAMLLEHGTTSTEDLKKFTGTVIRTA
jgi:hypothetical protein